MITHIQFHTHILESANRTVLNKVSIITPERCRVIFIWPLQFGLVLTTPGSLASLFYDTKANKHLCAH